MPSDSENIMLAIGRLEGKMDALIRFNARLEMQLAQHDDRIRKLESHRAHQIGAAAAVSALASTLVSILWNKTQ